MEELDPKWIRVSSILAMMPTLDADGKWGYPMYDLNQEMLQRKADLGSNVHAAINAHAKGEFPVLSDQEEPYFDSFLAWEKTLSLKVYKTEQRLYFEPMLLTGCIDMMGYIEGRSDCCIVDFKCTVAADHRKWPIQAAFYELLASMNGYKVSKKCLFVQLDSEGGSPKVHEYEITKELSQAALSLYNSYMYLTKRYT